MTHALSLPGLAGATSFPHKAASLLHSVLLEVGHDSVKDYCNQVIATLSDQGQIIAIEKICVLSCMHVTIYNPKSQSTEV